MNEYPQPSDAHGHMWSRSRQRHNARPLTLSECISTLGDARQRPTLPGLAQTEYKEEHGTSASLLWHRGQRRVDRVGCGHGCQLAVICIPDVPTRQPYNASELPRRPELLQTILLFPNFPLPLKAGNWMREWYEFVVQGISGGSKCVWHDMTITTTALTASTLVTTVASCARYLLESL